MLHIQLQWMGVMDDMLWNGSDEDGDVSVRKKKMLPVKMKIITLIGKKRQNRTCFVC